ncbi:MAG: hypothetical protein IPK04_21950 [Bdellovibrionales bacterium]|nr:hypothetical protein [Bdellovibrionales bacterium]
MKVNKRTTFFVDICTVLLSYGPPVISTYVTIYLLQMVDQLIVQVILFPLVLQFCFVSSIFLFRISLPKLKPGVYETNFNKGFVAWYSHSMLTRSARCFGIHYLIHCTATMRWLYWRALGAKIPYDMSTSIKVTIHDAAVITILSGTTLSEDVNISGHLVRGDKILVAPVKIGKNVFIGRKTYIGPRTRIGDNAWIGMGNTLTGAVITANQRVKSHERDKA